MRNLWAATLRALHITSQRMTFDVNVPDDEEDEARSERLDKKERQF